MSSSKESYKPCKIEIVFLTANDLISTSSDPGENNDPNQGEWVRRS